MDGELVCRLGVDVGGTFTDLVLVTQDGRLVTRKVLSTSSNYAEATAFGSLDWRQDGHRHLYGERIVVLKLELEIWGTSLTVGSARRRLGVDYAVMRRVLAAEL